MTKAIDDNGGGGGCCRPTDDPAGPSANDVAPSCCAAVSSTPCCGPPPVVSSYGCGSSRQSLEVATTASGRHNSPPPQQQQQQQQDQRETLRLCIGGMTCSGCCTRIESYVGARPGILGVRVSLLTGRGIVEYDPRCLGPEAIEALVTTLGFAVTPLPPESTVSLVITAGTEPSARVAAAASAIPGVIGVRESPAVSSSSSSSTGDSTVTGAGEGAVVVDYDPDRLGPRALVRALSQALGGVDVHVENPRPQSLVNEEREVAQYRRSLGWCVALALPLVIIEYLVPLLSASLGAWTTTSPLLGIPGLTLRDLVGFVSATPILLGIARPIHAQALSALRYTRRVTMDVLVSLSSFSAYVFSVVTVLGEISVQRKGLPTEETAKSQETFFVVTALLLTLILVGRVMEKTVKAQAARSVEALTRIQAKTAVLVDGPARAYIDVLLVEPGDLLKVYPGARVPTDGVVVEGTSAVDESMLTGEARKVPKTVGSIVLGGTINARGVLVMRVTHSVHESMLARIQRLVESAQATPAPSAGLADVVASHFTLFIVTLAGLMLVVWYELAHRGIIATTTDGETPFTFALRFAITILVISCPCAISLAVPTAILVATTVGSQAGLLFKGGRALEGLDHIDVVLFDKTGTLTSGHLEVVEFIETLSSSSPAAPNVDRQQLWAWLAAVEAHSEHAIGRAIHGFAQKIGTPLEGVTVSGFEALPGQGVRAVVDGREVLVGSDKWVRETIKDRGSMSPTPAERLHQEAGAVVVHLAVDGCVVANVVLQDTARPEARFVVDQLQRHQLEAWMVTGDQQTTAQAVARDLGLPQERVIAEALPQDKLEAVRRLQRLGHRVAFVGDGINDAPALALADVGIALGAGTEVAIDSADVVLVKDDLLDLLNAFDLAAATTRRIRRNFAWGIGYNLVMMPLACGALYPFLGLTIPPAMAGLSELLSSVPVVLFSLLLRSWRPPFRPVIAGTISSSGSSGNIISSSAKSTSSRGHRSAKGKCSTKTTTAKSGESTPLLAHN